MTGPNVTTSTQATPHVATPGSAGGVPGITTDASGNITGLISPTGNSTLVGSAVQVFTASGTWTNPGAGRTVRVICIGGGGGGGSGGSIVSGTASSGGGGGGAGGYMEATFPSSALAGSVTVTVGASGTAGATATGAVGNGGGVGGNTTFDSLVTAFGGGGGAG